MQYKCQIYKCGALTVLDNIINCFIDIQFIMNFRPILSVFNPLTP